MAECPVRGCAVAMPAIHPNIIEYADRKQLQIVRTLGFGIHGTVAAAITPSGLAAIKHHFEEDPFVRELDIYYRLSELNVRQVGEFRLPRLLGWDESLRIIEMSIVPRPFILDFAGAYLDWPPEFSAEIWADWEARRKEEYGDRWPIVRAALDEFEAMGIFILDVHPSNISFRD
jgi:hypothetical protein